ncbi:MAG TPA: GDCCVxC domain-containing (seleno)protein [Pyrinomonadaceae bacterium]|nr:GDCCVxC domain-containing (seleno)protein [Pyrinomonadaceae bacterium]
MECEITVSRKSLITCPQCGFQQEEDMPSDSCLFFYECVACRSRLRPFPGDCCVFCSHGTVKCPSRQQPPSLN